MRPGLRKQGEESVEEVHLLSQLAAAFRGNASTAGAGGWVLLEREF